MTIESFTANWIGRCPVKGCKNVLHLAVEMTRERWTETRHDGANGTKREVPKSREFATKFGWHWGPGHLELRCVRHRYEFRWRQVEGRFSEAHKCDARCMNATGPNCECSCGGQNHGRAHSVSLGI